MSASSRDMAATPGTAGLSFRRGTEPVIATATTTGFMTIPGERLRDSKKTVSPSPRRRMASV